MGAVSDQPHPCPLLSGSEVISGGGQAPPTQSRAPAGQEQLDAGELVRPPCGHSNTCTPHSQVYLGDN